MKRLSPALLTVLLFCVVGVLVALYVVKNILGAPRPVAEDEVLTIPMALTDLVPGTRVTEGHIGLGRARRSTIGADVVRTDRVVVGRVVKNTIKAAAPISTFDLYPLGQGPGLTVAPGMRAVTISLASSTSLADGQIQPEQYVDVHFTPSSVPDAERTGGLTMTLFQGVKVLAINGSSTSTSAGRSDNTVTLELTEGQANIILLAKDRGSLDLVYTPDGKGEGIVAVDDEHRATLQEILGLSPQVPRGPFTTEIFVGSGRRLQQFENGQRTDDYAVDPVDYNRRVDSMPRSGPPLSVPDAPRGAQLSPPSQVPGFPSATPGVAAPGIPVPPRQTSWEMNSFSPWGGRFGALGG